MSRPEPETDVADVDFVVGAAAPIEVDDELPATPHTPWVRRAALLAALALVAAIVITQLARGHRTHRPVAAGSVSGNTAPVAAPSGVPSTPLDDSDAALLGPDPQAPVSFDPHTGVHNCPEIVACTTSFDVPAEVVKALRTSFPTVRVRTVHSVLGRQDGGTSTVLLERTISAVAGTTSLTIELHASTLSDVAKGRVELLDHSTITYYRDLVPQFTVSVSAERPRPAAGVSLETLAFLADDAGLLAND